MTALWLLIGFLLGAALATSITRVRPEQMPPETAVHPTSRPEWPAGHTFMRIGDTLRLRHPGCAECEALSLDDK